jgi:hypothetical protein
LFGVVRRARLRFSGGVAGPVVRLWGLALLLALGGCSPVETWRSMTGVNKNDPDPETALFTGNLAKAEAAGYPNLATVPPPPTRATSTAERQKLTENLMADREGARAPAPVSRPGPIVAPALPPPPAFAVPRKAPLASLPPVPEPKTASASDDAAGGSDGSKTDAAKSAGRNRRESGLRKAGEPPEPGPRDSGVQSPELAALPDPEPPRTAPPPPSLVAAPTTAAIAPIQPPAAVMAAGTPQAPPPPPPVAMTPPPPPPPTPGKAPQWRPPTGTTLATFNVAGEPDARNRELIERIAGLYKQKTDTIRVVGYAGAPAPGADPLDNYRAALDRAQSVAKLLGDAGMPANRIQTEATPAGGPDSTGGRVEIQLLP